MESTFSLATLLTAVLVAALGLQRVLGRARVLVPVPVRSRRNRRS